MGEVTLRRTCTGVRLSNVPPLEPHRGGDPRVGSTSGLGAKTVTPRSSSSLLSTHTQSRCRCGMGEPGPGADAAWRIAAQMAVRDGAMVPDSESEGGADGRDGGRKRARKAAALW